jgi:hypothetical protein
MDRECGRRMIVQTLINMKEDIRMIKNMDTENFNGVLEVNIRVIMLMIRKWDMERCIGKMEQFIEDFGKMENKMELD